MPVMEGKAMLFKEFAGVDAFPLCMDTKDVDEIVAFVKARRADVRRHQPRGHRGAALLRDRARGCAPSSTSRSSTTTSTAPRSSCSRRCSTRCAWSASAPRTSRVVVVGAGAAGVACTDIMLAQGVGDVDRLRPRRRAARGRATSTPSAPRSPSARTRAARRASADEVLAGADVLLGVSGPGAVTAGRRAHDGAPTRSCSRWPTRCPRSSRRRSATTSRSWPPAARTTRTRSTTCSRSRASSAARSTCARARSTRR